MKSDNFMDTDNFEMTDSESNTRLRSRTSRPAAALAPLRPGELRCIEVVERGVSNAIKRRARAVPLLFDSSFYAFMTAELNVCLHGLVNYTTFQ